MRCSQATGHFWIEDADGVAYHMRYCFRCGGILPSPNTHQFFHDPSAIEVDEATSFLSGVNTLCEIEVMLGPANEVKDLRCLPLVRGSAQRQHVFSSRWKTIDVYVVENTDGSIDTLIVPKQRDDSDCCG